MKTDSESLYKNYTSKSHKEDGIRARMKQRMKCLRAFQQSGRCKNKLQQFGILRREHD